MTRLILEASDSIGLDRQQLIAPTGFSERDFVADDARIEWSAFVSLLEQISRAVGHDAARLRDLGRRLLQTPSYAPPRRLARAIVSVRALYEIANRWVAPVSFPHLPFMSAFESARHMRLHVEIPEPYAPSAAFFHLCQGSVVNFPALIDLPPSVVLESKVTPRTFDLLIEIPRGGSILGRVRRGVTALLDAREALDVLEDQRRELEISVGALQRARDELRSLLDRMPDMVLVHADGIVLWANRALLTALGWKLEELVGTALIDLVAERSRALTLERMRQPPDAPGLPALTEAALRRRNGDEMVVEVAPAQGVIFEGVPARMIVGRDVTERVNMQQRLIVADRMASIGLLAAGVAHEVNNPLAYVLNNIEIARKELATLGPSAELSRQVLSVALEGVDRIRAIVHDLLQLSRGEDGTLGATDLRAVAESTLALAAGEIDRTCQLRRDFEPAPLVRASSGRIAQVLLNLVTNALEAMRDRPREGCQLLVRIARAPDGRALLEVKDSGPGIAPAHLPRLFEPFFTTKPAGQGTGLGLAIAHRLVVELGGEIEVTSTLGQGASFRVMLPPFQLDERRR